MSYPIEDAVPGRDPVIADPVPALIPRHRGLWFTLASVTALVVLAPTGGRVYSWMFAQSSESTWSSVHPISGLQVEVGSGDVQIGPGAADAVSVDQTLDWSLNKPSVREAWNGDDLVVSVSCTGGGGILLSTRCSAALDIKVPATVPVTVTSASGNVYATDMSGSLQVRADSGDVQLNSVSGPVSVQEASGTVSGQDLRASDVEVQADSSAIDLEFALPPQRVVSRVASGDTLIVVPSAGGYLITGQTSSGQRDIDPVLENGQSARTLAVDSDSGDVTIQAQH